MELRKSSEFEEKANRLYETIRSCINGKIPFSKFEHIGSTAIQGALTKGDFDFYLEVEPNCHQISVNQLIEYGFSVKRDTHRDKDLCMLEGKGAAIQVVSSGSKYEFFLHFRDKLNSNISLVEEYNRIKIESAILSESRYRVRKSEFIEVVLASL